MPENLRKELEQLWKRERDAAVAAVLDDAKSAAIRTDVARLESLKKLKDTLPKPNWERQIAAGIVVASFLIASILWYSRIPTVSVMAEVTAQQVTFALSEDWTAENLPQAQHMQLTGISWIGSSLLDEDVESAMSEIDLELSGHVLRLTRLWIEKDSELEIGRRGKNLQISVRQGSVEGVLEVHRPTALNVEDGGTFSSQELTDFPEDETEFVRFERQKGGAVPFRLILPDGHGATIHDLPVRALHFLDSSFAPVSEKLPDSTIENGTLRILDTGLQKEIRQGDFFVPGLLQVQRLGLELGPQIALVLEARTKTLQLGPRGFLQDLRPSRLEILSQDRGSVMVWTAFLFISGVLWNIRRTLWPSE